MTGTDCAVLAAMYDASNGAPMPFLMPQVLLQCLGKMHLVLEWMEAGCDASQLP